MSDSFPKLMVNEQSLMKLCAALVLLCSTHQLHQPNCLWSVHLSSCTVPTICKEILIVALMCFIVWKEIDLLVVVVMCSSCNSDINFVLYKLSGVKETGSLLLKLEWFWPNFLWLVEFKPTFANDFTFDQKDLSSPSN